MVYNFPYTQVVYSLPCSQPTEHTHGCIYGTPSIPRVLLPLEKGERGLSSWGVCIRRSPPVCFSERDISGLYLPGNVEEAAQDLGVYIPVSLLGLCSEHRGFTGVSSRFLTF